MKPRNFPARKLARQISAEVRTSGGVFKHSTARSALSFDPDYFKDARAVRTKKNRSSKF